MIDLDDAEFDEFNLSEDAFAELAAAMVDDRSEPKRQKLDRLSDDGSSPMDLGTRPAEKSISKETVSLPAKLQRPASSASGASVKAVLTERKAQYLSAAKLKARDPAKNKEYRVMAAQFSRVVKALDQGQDIDLSQMPGPPPGFKSSYNIDLSKFKPDPQAKPPAAAAAAAAATPPKGQSASSSEPDPPDDVDPEIPVPKTPLEALEQRLAKYKEGHKSATENGESSRVRRMGRIVKQYEDAIKTTKAGRPCNHEELPVPPGYPPIPVQQVSRPVRQLQQPVLAAPTQSLPVQQTKQPPRKLSDNQRQQFAQVEQRRSELLAAAKQARDNGDKEKAGYYVRQYKGLDTMLRASQSGLPVNLDEMPPSPFANVSKTKPAADLLSHLKPASEGDSATFDLLEKQLQKQIDLSSKNAETYEKMGSQGPANHYKNITQTCQKELLAIKAIRSQGLGPPKFTTETRKISIIHTNAHLSQQQCEVDIVRALNLPRPSGYDEKDLNIYIEVEFPWPSDDQQKEKTGSVKHTCNPEFDVQLKFDINRKQNRSMQRVFKRTPVKCQLWQSRTLRKDLFMGEP